jgi:glycosyltransferase involved in cell wall biosynthesis
MKKKLNVLYLTSENTTTSIPLELASYLCKSDKINLHIVTYYGQVANEPRLSFAEDVIDLNVPKPGLKKGFYQLNKLIKEIKPDIIHVHHNMSALMAILAAKYHKIKLIIKTEHNDHRFLKWYQKLLNIPILLLTDIVICNSISTKNSFYSWERLLASKKAIPIYNGINIAKILGFSGDENNRKIKEKYDIHENEQLFFCAARLIKQKNLENLVRAFSLASCENKNIRLLIAGAGNLSEPLLILKKQLDQSNKIQFLGILPREEIFRLMSASDYFIMISLWEGFCNAVVEAMVANCAIICSDISTLHEVVGADVGYFVNPKSVSDIKKAILKFSNMDEQEKRLWANKSFKRATELFSIEKTAEQYMDQYLKALS